MLMLGAVSMQGLWRCLLLGVRVPAVPATGFLSHAQFVQLRKAHLFFQDAVLAAFQLWNTSIT